MSEPREARPASIEALDRPALEQRYRLTRNICFLLAAMVVVLSVVAGVQLFQLGEARGAAQAPVAGMQDAPAADQQAGEGATGGGDSAPAAEAGCAEMERRQQGDPMAMGDLDAPVVLAEWTDFRCPFCGVFSRDTLPVLIEEYIDTGKVRLEVHDVEFIDGEVSARVAVAARAAGEQDRYFDYLFEVYGAMEDARPDITDEILVEYARASGVPDLARFERDLDSPELLDDVRQSSAQAQRLSIGSVPAFADSTTCRLLAGAQPVEQFRAYLDEAIEAASVS